ncbi:MAG: ABC transporter related protein, partial [uncultured bacterium]
PITALSGGERNRLLLARLFAKSTNLLIMDEPTNDLDIDTLEILEDLLLDYSGTLLLVSHDREFLNNLVTSTIALDGQGNAVEYVGGYDDWVRQSQASLKPSEPGKSFKTTVIDTIPEAKAEQNRKLSYKEQKAIEARQVELAELPARIEELEKEQAQIGRNMAETSFYQGDVEEIANTAARLKEIEDELAQAYQRWEELDNA